MCALAVEVNVCLMYTKEKQVTIFEVPGVKPPKTRAGMYHSLTVQEAKSS